MSLEPKNQPLTFSVIIPTFNESDRIAECISCLRAIYPGIEIIVSDGKSFDETVSISRKMNVKVIQSPKLRGLQCNVAANTLLSDIFIFMHADSRLSYGVFAKLGEAFSDTVVKVGVLRLSVDINHWLLKFYSLCNRVDSVLTRFGDQCIVVRRDFFQKIGGFDELNYFDDVMFFQKARKFTKIHLLPAKVITSGRRFKKNGICKQYFYDAWLMLQYILGVSPYRLALKYEKSN
ncbi:MAG: TIGR04283 family arsenosugar biosynthesis glycosyltransferase [Candidatus Omnitrophota bacterium]